MRSGTGWLFQGTAEGIATDAVQTEADAAGGTEDGLGRLLQPVSEGRGGVLDDNSLESGAPDFGSALDKVLSRIDKSFFAREDPKALIKSLDADAESNRVRIRQLLDEVVAHFRGRLDGAVGGDLDLVVDDLALALDLRRALDGNVSADLVFERLVDRLLARAASTS